MEDFEGADWVLISDEVPVDEHRRDELLETFRSPITRGAEDGDDEEGRARGRRSGRRPRGLADHTGYGLVDQRRALLQLGMSLPAAATLHRP